MKTLDKNKYNEALKLLNSEYDNVREYLYWCSEEGDNYLCELDDNHLINIGLWLSRKIDELKKYKLPMITKQNIPLDIWLKLVHREINYRIPEDDNYKALRYRGEPN